jgi:hypothetical protein
MNGFDSFLYLHPLSVVVRTADSTPGIRRKPRPVWSAFRMRRIAFKRRQLLRAAT